MYNIDLKYMDYAIQLAKNGYGLTSPNPMVGAVLVHQGRVIGRGWHEKFGHAHAEVNCIQSVLPEDQHLISKSSLYVTLEPCNHFGKTPPCTQLIIDSQIPHVVIGSGDNFKEVNGTGIQRLRGLGLQVDLLDHAACYELNKAFFYFHQFQSPYITLKWAETAHGYIGSGNDQRLFISNAMTQKWVHYNRLGQQAILVGAQTILHDNPLLDVRQVYNDDHLLKVIWDEDGILSTHYQIFSASHDIVIFTRNEHLKEVFKELRHVRILICHNDFISATREYLVQKNILALYVEGGRAVLQSFIDAGVYQEIHRVVSDKLSTYAHIKAPRLTHDLLLNQKFDFDNDHVYIYHNKS